MARVRLTVTGPLKKEVGGEVLAEVAEGTTLLELLKARASALVRDGKLRDDHLFLINGVDAELLGGARAKLNDGDAVAVVPIAHGGRRRWKYRTSSSNTLLPILV